MLTRTFALAATLAAFCCLCAAGPALAWTPEAASYGVGETQNVTITASDGTKLYANVYYPTDPKTGAAAAGPFPVILTQTPYGKNTGDEASTVNPTLAGLAGSSSYLVQRGYIQIVTDVRGTGASGGEFDLFQPSLGTDGAGWVNYAATLPHSDGVVGLLGASYLGIDQFETAADAGSAHVKAMFPIIAANDLYRDTAFAGGFPDIEFDSFYLGLTGGLNLLNPLYEGESTLANALVDHAHDLTDFDTALLANAETGGDDAYDQRYWGARNPNRYIEQIVHDGIPAFLIGGWYDLFQRGELLNYSSFQNAFAGRPMLGPMSPAQRATPRYQLLMGPWYHVTTGSGLSWHGLDLNGMELAWFDHWLKGIDTGITDSPTTLHLENLGTGKYDEANGYPVDGTTDTTYYLQPGGGLSSAKPAADGGASSIVFDGTQIPCTSSLDQWAAGLGATIFSYLDHQSTDPCTQNADLSQIGPGTSSYTTAPVSAPTTIAGPIGATLYATTTTKDAEWVVQVSDVAADGAATSLTSGLLEGNQRAEDSSMSWRAPDGNPLLPWHYYTAAQQSPITPGQLTKFDVEIFPTYDTLEPGHSLRITIASSDFPHALPTLTQAANLLGGVYEIGHSAAEPSNVELPIVTGDMAGHAGTAPPATGSGKLGCPAPRGRLTATALAGLRLGMTRTEAGHALAGSSTRTERHFELYCLRGQGISAGYLAGRVVLALTANRYYSLDGVRAGQRFSRLPRADRIGPGYRLGAASWYLVRLGKGRGVLEVRHGVIQAIGIAAASRVRNPAAARRFFRSFD